jgi:hypothetical protein
MILTSTIFHRLGVTDRHGWLFWVSDKFRASPRPTAFYAVPRKRSTISGSIGSTASV